MDKSTIKKIKDLNLDDKEIVITELFAEKQMVDFHYEKMKQTSDNKMPEEEIWKRINTLVVRENVFNNAMQKIVSHFECNINKQEIEDLTKRILENISKGQDKQPINEESIKAMAKNMIIKKLVFEYLADLWKIKITDEDVKTALNKYYELTNKSIRDILNNKEQFESVRDMIFEERMIDTIISKTKHKFDLKKPEPKKEAK